MRARRSIVAALAAAAALGWAALASGAPTSLVAGRGDHPSVAVDSTGVAHVVFATTSGYDESEGVLNAIGYCRISVGGSACEGLQILLPLERTEGEFSAPEITVVGTDTLVVTDTRCCGTGAGRWVLVSSDGGATWQTTHPTLLERGNAGGPSRAAMLEVVHPTDGTLSMIGGTFFAFGLPTMFRRVDRQAPTPEAGTEPQPDFQGDGTNRVNAQALGLLPDGRLFAVGFHFDAPTVTGLFWRSSVPGADPNDPTTGWTTWRRLGLPGFVESLAYAPGRPTLLLVEGAGFALRAAPFDGLRVGTPRLLGGSVGAENTNRGSWADLTVDAAGRQHAVWLTTQEGCDRGKLCLVYRRAEPGRAFGPKEVVRAIADDGDESRGLQLPVVAAGRGGVTWAAWVEYAGTTRFGEIRLASLCTSPLPGCQANQAVLGNARLVLEAPRDLVTRRSLEARVTGAGIRKVVFTLVPPVCPPSVGSCYALRRPVRVTRTGPPFKATFSDLPQALNISTTDPLKNTLCGADAYLYGVRAEVQTAQGRAVLLHDVSVCPKIR